MNVNPRWPKRRWITSLFIICMILLSAQKAIAHRDDYIDETLVYLTLEKSELEAEYWFDYGNESNSQDNFVRHNFASELGITDHWMVDARVTLREETGRSLKYDAGRIETRYRLFDEGTLPVDIALSGEINWKRQEDGSSVVAIEPRMILSKDFRDKFNFTLNLSEEIPATSDPTAFLIALGVRDNLSRFIRFGSELQYDTQEQSGSIIPQIWFAFPKGVTLKIGYSAGLDNNQENFGRIAFEAEF